MHGIEATGLFARHMNTLGSDDAQTIAFKAVNDFAGQIALGASGLMIEKVRSMAIGSSSTLVHLRVL